MSRYLLILIATLSNIVAQNKQLLYDFNVVPQSVLLNPGSAPNNDLYIGIPLLSHLHLNFGSSGVNAYDLFVDDGVDFNTKLSRVIYNMENTDNITLTQQLDLFSAGFRVGKIEHQGYISFGMYQETDFHLYFPKDYALLGYEGNANNLYKIYDLSHLNVTAELISALHVGYSKKLNKKR